MAAIGCSISVLGGKRASAHILIVVFLALEPSGCPPSNSCIKEVWGEELKSLLHLFKPQCKFYMNLSLALRRL